MANIFFNESFKSRVYRSIDSADDFLEFLDIEMYLRKKNVYVDFNKYILFLTKQIELK